MIRYFPSPYPDESIYSLFVRYGKHMGNSNAFSSIKELLGKMHLRISPLFTGNLSYLCSNLPEDTEFTPEYFINKHTVLPMYRPFVPVDRYQKAVEALKNGSLNSVNSLLGITAGSILNIKGLKYCPECIIEDDEKFGEAYLHNSHQIEGVFACYKHKCLLKIHEADVDSREELFDIGTIAEKCEDTTIIPILTDEIHSLVSDVDFLINHFDLLGDFENVRKKYNVCMHESNYISPSGLINQVQLQNDFFEFYTKSFLNQLQSDIETDVESYWLRTITRKKLKAVHPIRHLIFIRFLFGSVQNFTKYSNTEYLPFGEPPYPCLNRNSDHYKSLLVNKCSIKTNHHTSKAIGLFECSECGYAYTLNRDAYEKSGFEKVIAKKNRKIYSYYDKELEIKYKDEIIALITEEPNKSRRAIIKSNSKAYRWLYKHEKEWLENRILKPLKHSEFYKNDRINWEERDRETLVKSQSAVNDILNNRVLRKIGVTVIANVINYRALSRDLEKMPLTKEFIKNSEESYEQFHKRKIDFAISGLIVEERKLARHEILRRAGIPSNYYNNYDEYINQILEKDFYVKYQVDSLKKL